ncbi:MAG: CBS domain-containing protein [Acidobacteriota bacterium]|nr:CBS domain-containing protein [Acidobacteriota bacterium]
MKVHEIMTSDPRTATPDTTLLEIATMMKEEDVGVIPIVDDDRVIGVVSDRDIVLRCVADGKDANDCTAEDVMSTGVKTIDPESDVDDAARKMAEARIRRLPVAKNGKLVGMLSLGDIAVNASESEEETTAETLEEVSQGVKGQGRKQRSTSQPASTGSRSASEREAQNARREQRKTEQKKSAQGVSNRASRTKQSQNQKKVAAKVAPRRSTGRRRAS